MSDRFTTPSTGRLFAMMVLGLFVAGAGCTSTTPPPAQAGGDAESTADVGADTGTATAALGATTNTCISIENPANNTEFVYISPTTTVTIDIGVTGVTLEPGGHFYNVYVDGAFLFQDTATSNIEVFGLPKGLRHIAVQLADADGTELANSCARDGIHVKIVDSCTTVADCTDGLSCSNEGCTAGSCGYGAVSDCCDSDMECENGWFCEDNTCKQCQTDAQCDDGVACTIDFCNPDTSQCENDYQEDCCAVDGDCDDELFCTSDFCDGDQCVFTQVADPTCCDADSDCVTDDPCILTTCYISASKGVQTCRTGPANPNCCTDQADCDDGNSCTLDSCFVAPGELAGECSFVADPAQPDCCVDKGDCNDGDDFTIDACVDNLCQHIVDEAFCNLPAPVGVVISEVMAAPGELSDDEAEWFEVYNSGDTFMVIHNWTIETSIGGAVQGTHTINSPTLDIPPGGYVTLSRFVNKSLTGFTSHYGYGDGIDLLDPFEDETFQVMTLTLKDKAGAVVDSLTWDNNYDLLDSRSLERRNPYFDSSDIDTWRAAGTAVQKSKNRTYGPTANKTFGSPRAFNNSSFIGVIDDTCELPEGSDLCSEARCDLNNECQFVKTEDCCLDDGDCDDGNACTTQQCIGGDVHECTEPVEVANCCLSNSECDDGNTCNLDRCIGNRCRFSANIVAGCCFADGDCDDGNPCTVNTCNDETAECNAAAPVGGECCIADSQCDDGEPSTSNVCDLDTNQCVYDADPDYCTQASDPCDDGNPCTEDSCAVGPQTCNHLPIPGCCAADAECPADGNDCTAAVCLDDNTCDQAAIAGCCLDIGDCDDDNPCTEDFCNATNICHYRPVEGCCETDAECNDGDACTDDVCGNEGLCLNQQQIGCCHEEASEGELIEQCGAHNDICDVWNCVAGNCQEDIGGGCCETHDECDDGNDCTINFCQSGNTCKTLPLTNGGCCASNFNCANAEYCNLALSQCQPKLGQGEICLGDQDCETDVCTLGECTCQAGFADDPEQAGEDCLLPVCVPECLPGFECTVDGCVRITPGWNRDVQPILEGKCGDCHDGDIQGTCEGDTCFVHFFSDVAKDSQTCAGQSVADCMLVLLEIGQEPQGAGCTGEPALDAGKPGCLTGAELRTIENWLDNGQDCGPDGLPCDFGNVCTLEGECDSGECIGVTPCENNGDCSFDGNLHICGCSSGFAGVDCEIDVDACTGGTRVGVDTLPITGNSSLTDLVIVQNPATRVGCVESVEVVLATPPAGNGVAWEARVYELTGTAGVLRGKTGFTVDTAIIGEPQTIELPNCLDIELGWYVGVTNLDGDTEFAFTDEGAGYLFFNDAGSDVVDGDSETFNQSEGGIGFGANIKHVAPCQNDSTCTDHFGEDPSDGYTCECLPGFEGFNCEIDGDNCDPNPCVNGGSCADVTDDYVCTCPPGFSGKDCQIDEDECTVTVGVGPDTLPDTNASSSHIVVNAEGAPIDGCIRAVTLALGDLPDGDGSNWEFRIYETSFGFATLIDARPISINPNTTNEQTIGIEPCLDIDEGQKIGIINLDGATRLRYSLAAGEGYLYLTKAPGDSIGDSTALNTWSGDSGFKALMDRPACDNGSICTDLADDFSCECLDGFEGDKTCDIDIDECDCANIDPGQVHVESSCGEGVVNPCQNGAVCSDHVYDYSCECPPGFDGIDCEIDVNNCGFEPCENGSSCTDLDAEDDYECTCEPGYKGKNCEQDFNNCALTGRVGNDDLPAVSEFLDADLVLQQEPAEYDGCIDTITMRLGSGVNGAGEGWVVQVFDVDYGPGNADTNQATLVSSLEVDNVANSAGVTQIVQLSECVDVAKGQYIGLGNTNGSTNLTYVLEDTDGDGLGYWTSASTPSTEIGGTTTVDAVKYGVAGFRANLKHPVLCQNGAACVDLVDFYECVCPNGYEGYDCEIDIDECAQGFCQNGSVCVDNVFDYTCICPDGYDGKDCEIDLNECDPDPCVNGGDCTDHVFDYFCECPDGYSGKDCEVNDDECDPVQWLGEHLLAEQDGGSAGGTAFIQATAAAQDGVVSSLRARVYVAPPGVDSDAPGSASTFYVGVFSNSGGSEGGIEGSIPIPEFSGGACIDLDSGSSVAGFGPCSPDDDLFFDGLIGVEVLTQEDPCELFATPYADVTSADGCQPRPSFFFTDEYNADFSTVLITTDAGVTFKVAFTGTFSPDQTLIYEDLAGAGYTLEAWTAIDVDTSTDQEQIFDAGDLPISAGQYVGVFSTDGDFYLTSDDVGAGFWSSDADLSGLGIGGSIASDDLTAVDGEVGFRADIPLGLPCQNGSICSDEVFDYSCACQPGYSDKDCSTNDDECDPHPCNESECVDLVNDYQCECDPGYIGEDCEIDSNDCADEVLYGIGANDFPVTNQALDEVAILSRPAEDPGCITEVTLRLATLATAGEFEIRTYELYADTVTLRGKLPLTFNQNATSQQTIELPECLPINEGHFVAIANTNGNLKLAHTGADGAGYWALAEEASTAVNGEAETFARLEGDIAFNANLDFTFPCENGATCVDLLDDYECICPPGFTGRDCEINVDECTCTDLLDPELANDQLTLTDGTCAAGVGQPSPCVNGSCNDFINNYTCDCEDGWSGYNCDVNDSECDPDPCVNGSACVDEVFDYTCICLDGYEGKDCEIDIDECAADPCVNGSTCVDLSFDYFCECPDGYSGKDCEIDDDECAPVLEFGPHLLPPTEDLQGDVVWTDDDVIIWADEAQADSCVDSVRVRFGAPPENGTGGIELRTYSNTDGVNAVLTAFYSLSELDADSRQEQVVSIEPCFLVLEGETIGIANYDGDLNITVDGDGDESYYYRNEGSSFDLGEIDPVLFDIGDVGFRADLVEFPGEDDSRLPACINGSACVDNVFDYTCLCEPGYFGKDCEIDINECATDTAIGPDNVPDVGASADHILIANTDVLLAGCVDEVSFALGSNPPGNEQGWQVRTYTMTGDQGVMRGFRTLAQVQVSFGDVQTFAVEPCLPISANDMVALVNTGGQLRVGVDTVGAGTYWSLATQPNAVIDGPAETFNRVSGVVGFNAHVAHTLPCVNGSSCNDLVNNYSCTCPPGFSAYDCDVNDDECILGCEAGDGAAGSPLWSNCCDDGSLDFAREGRAGCDESTCEADVCNLNPGCCSGTWDDTCVTLAVALCNDLCRPEPVCTDGLCNGDEDCDSCPEDCLPTECTNAATCVDGDFDYSCECAPGFAEGDKDCDVNINDCQPDPCVNGGTCVDLVDGWACICPEGYEGNKCQVDLDDCTFEPCENPDPLQLATNACTDELHDYTCSCADGYEGKDCEVDINECDSAVEATQIVEFAYDSGCLNLDDLNNQVLPAGSAACDFEFEYSAESTFATVTTGASTTAAAIDDFGPFLVEDAVAAAESGGGGEASLLLEYFTETLCIDLDTGDTVAGFGPGSCPPGFELWWDQLDLFSVEDAAACSIGAEYSTVTEADALGCAGSVPSIFVNDEYARAGSCCIEQTLIVTTNLGATVKVAFDVDASPDTTTLYYDDFGGGGALASLDGAPFSGGWVVETDDGTYYKVELTDTKADHVELQFLKLPVDPPTHCVNGSVCTDLEFDYHCACAPGFVGKDCETDVDGCGGGDPDLNPCQNGAVCTDLVDSYSCDCPDGFTGTNCEINIDECEQGNCLNGSECEDLVFDYFCHCEDGYEGKDCEVDIDECAGDPCMHDAPCEDLVFDYYCHCDYGYSGKNCQTNDDECAPDDELGPHLLPPTGALAAGAAINSQPSPDDVCIDRVKIRFNAPPEGGADGIEIRAYEEDGGDLVLLAKQSISVDADSTEDQVVVVSPCFNLFAGELFGVANANGALNVTFDDEPFDENTCCNETFGTPGCGDERVESCVCAKDDYCCEVEWDDICAAETDSFGCAECASGYLTLDTPSGDPQAEFETPDGDGTHVGFQVANPQPAPCDNGSTCTDMIFDYSCACPNGFSGKDCETDDDECALGLCQNGSECTDLVFDYHCTCPAGIVGEDCEINADECRQTAILGPDTLPGGSAIPQADLIVYREASELDGCIDSISLQISNVPVGGGAGFELRTYTMFAHTATLTGKRSVPINGNLTNKQTIVVEPCFPIAQGEFLGLANTNGDLRLRWDSTKAPGLWQKNGNLNNIVGNSAPLTPKATGAVAFNAHASYEFPCENGSACNDDNVLDDYNCVCLAGFDGKDCEIDLDDCDPDPCLNGSTCVDGIDSYSCECLAGYEGQDCQINSDDCSPDPCQNFSTCVDLVDDYSCTCEPGYDGKECQININECDPDQCVNGACVDGINGFVCSCDDGWDSTLCDNNIDECDPDQCGDGTCVDLINDFSCDCDPGFRGDLCDVNINECLQESLSGPSILPPTGASTNELMISGDQALKDGCIDSVTFVLGSPPDGFGGDWDVRVYSVTDDVATLIDKRGIAFDGTDLTEQTVAVSPCLPVAQGQYIGLANNEGRLRLSFAPEGGVDTECGGDTPDGECIGFWYIEGAPFEQSSSGTVGESDAVINNISGVPGFHATLSFDDPCPDQICNDSVNGVICEDYPCCAFPLMITGVIDGDMAGGKPKGVELFACQSIPDLSAYALGTANNGGGTDGEEFALPAESLGAGQRYYVSADNNAESVAAWDAYFGFQPDFANGDMNVNGNDAVELFWNGDVIDTFGDLTYPSGSSATWHYTDGYASRKSDTGGDASVFDEGNWNVGNGTFDGLSASGAAAIVDQNFGSYTCGDIGTP